MSKIGRMPIDVSQVQVTVSGQMITVKAKSGEFVYEVPAELSIRYNADEKKLSLWADNATREVNMNWGLHRALLSNKVTGVVKGFTKKVTLVGLGFKGQLAGKVITFSLGYSHKIEYTIPEGVKVDIDKTGQNLVVSSHDKFLLGNVCDAIRSFKMPEPYKGTGVVREGDVIIRKAGKTKA